MQLPSILALTDRAQVLGCNCHCYVCSTCYMYVMNRWSLILLSYKGDRVPKSRLSLFIASYSHKLVKSIGDGIDAHFTYS